MNTNIRKSLLSVALILSFGAFGFGQILKPVAAKSIELRKLATTKKIVIVKPLARDAKLARIKPFFNNAADVKKLDSSTILDKVTLSVAAPVNNGSFLKFNLAAQISPRENDAFFEPLQNQEGANGVLVGFKVAEAGAYVFDFSTHIYDVGPGDSPVVFHFGNLFGIDRQDINISKNDGHTIFLAQNVAAGMTYFFLTGDKASWDFYSVNISQLKLSN